MRKINTVTVIGANGTMGRNISAIFASFGNAKVYLVSRSIDKSIQARDKAYMSVRAESIKENMFPSDYEHLDKCVEESDIVFEACAESWVVKEKIHAAIVKSLNTIDPKCAADKVFCSGTSGLSITRLANIYPEQLSHQFMGMHFFNPPYQMTLCEMTPTQYTKSNPKIFEEIKNYTETTLKRTVVETPDAPAFLGNRIGFQFINEALQMAEHYRYNGGIDYIDAILGPFTGRTMAPLVTANFVGLDIHKAIVENLYDNTNDYAHDTLLLPEFANQLITDGKTGKKAGAGLYKTILHDSGIKIHQVYDIERQYYREKINYSFPFVEEMLHSLKTGDYKEAFKILVSNYSQEATLCCRFLIQYILYSLYITRELGCLPEAADDVMATGFHWCPPLAMLEAFETVTDFRELCIERIDKKILEIVQLDDLLSNINKSKYDYRKFILAKK